MKLPTQFKFGRGFVPVKFTLNDFESFFRAIDFPRPSAQISYSYSNGTSGSAGYTPNPQKEMTGIKKYYFSGKYPRPRNY